MNERERRWRNSWRVCVVGVSLVCAVFFCACRQLGGIADDVDVVDGSSPIDAAHDGQSGPDGGADAGSTDARVEAACEVGTPTSCGSCGHDCLGGACMDGACQPIALVRGIPTDGDQGGGPNRVAVDATRVFWTSDVGVFSADKIAGGTSPPPLAPIPPAFFGVAYAIAVDDDAVYWSNVAADNSGGSIAKCAKAGCDGGGALLANDVSYVESIVVDNGPRFYFSDNVGRLIGGRDKSDGGGAVAIASSLNQPLEAALDAQFVYWADADGSFYRASRNGGGASTLLARTQLCGNASLALTGGAVYASCSSTTSSSVIVSFPQGGIGGAAPSVLAGNLAGLLRVAVDASFVYWTELGPLTGNDYAAGAVKRCALSGCGGTPELLATGQHRVRGIAVDGTAIYWVNGGNGVGSNDGAIVKRAK